MFNTDLNLKSVNNALLAIRTKWFDIGLQLGISRNKLLEFKDDPNPLSAVIDYWLKGNLDVPVCWKSIVTAVKTEQETQLAEEINKKYCQKEGQNSLTPLM